MGKFHALAIEELNLTYFNSLFRPTDDPSSSFSWSKQLWSHVMCVCILPTLRNTIATRLFSSIRPHTFLKGGFGGGVAVRHNFSGGIPTSCVILGVLHTNSI